MNKLKDTARLAKALIFLVIGVITFPLSIVLFVGYFIACFILKFSYVTLPLIFFIVAWRHNYPDVSFFKSLPMTIDIFKKFDKAERIIDIVGIIFVMIISRFLFYPLIYHLGAFLIFLPFNLIEDAFTEFKRLSSPTYEEQKESMEEWEKTPHFINNTMHVNFYKYQNPNTLKKAVPLEALNKVEFNIPDDRIIAHGI